MLRTKHKRCPLALAALAALAGSGGAHAVTFDAGNGLQVEWDNTVTYNLGARTQKLDPLIANNPNFDESDYRFSKRGNLVTNRFALLTELTANYNQNFGARFSASAWKDFAYDGSSRTAPGEYAPAGGGLPAITYSSIGAYPNNSYTKYTKKYYEQGAQVLDAFALANFDLGGMPVYAKLGRLTQYWGNSFFFGFQGVSYSQGALDAIKATSSPGTQVKELFIPRPQLALTLQPLPDVEVGLQYMLGFEPNRLPAGGTYLGWTDFLFKGPTNFFLQGIPSAAVGLPAGGYVPFGLPAGDSPEPNGRHGNYGAKVQWSPKWLGGSIGAYYRKFDENQPWVPLFNFGAQGPTDYHMAYNRGVQLLGLSLEKTIGDVSAGFEVSYRHGTALNSAPNPAVAIETEGAKGNSLNVIANAIVPLGSTPVYNSGTLVAELAYTRLLKVTSNEALYQGVGYAVCTGQDKWDGCSTKNSLAVAILFTPQWQQVFPGVDLEMPISETYGISGNSATVGAGQPQGAHTYSIGLNAIVKAAYTVKLAYNGSHARAKGMATTPSGLPYYASGNGLTGLNDRGWVSLTLQAGF